MEQGAREPVVAGVDGSDRSEAAVGWAAREAERRRTFLRLVAVAGDAGTRHLGDVGGPGYPHEVRREGARGRLAGAAARAREGAPGVRVEVELADGDPGPELVSASQGAELVVVGNSAHGGLSGLMMGSVLTMIAGRTACPLIAVRTPTSTSGAPVVIGVDDPAADAAALGFAFEAAHRAEVTLVVVHTWIGTDDAGGPRDTPTARLPGWSRRYPDVKVHDLAGRDRPADALVELADGAQLVVLGSRGRSAIAGALLGSVGRDVLHRARCPVAIVPRGDVTGTPRTSG